MSENRPTYLHHKCPFYPLVFGVRYVIICFPNTDSQFSTFSSLQCSPTVCRYPLMQRGTVHLSPAPLGGKNKQQGDMRTVQYYVEISFMKRNEPKLRHGKLI